ncbi:uncharacterized protein LOC131249491 [Magnolia sinica]|uniref:uncharacterized protein LOC131249491 n=1 Tax=Magnolia sinica TaxID=86752 RepID=UPI00265AE592|nr:uncharacterized protein LOC131249491 [Magnolia sinica]
MTITNHKVYRIRLGIPRSHLRPIKTPLYGFAGEKVISEGAISLPVTVGEGQHQVTLMVDFLIINVPSVHNIILRRPSLNAMRAVISTYHLMMKFPTEGGTGYLRGDQHESRRCYAIVVKKGSVKQAFTVNILDPRGPTEDSPVEDLEKVPFDEADPSKIVQLRTSLSSEQWSEMLTFLQRHKDVFAWSHRDMARISPDVMVHRLNADPDCKPVKQKRRPFDAERYEAIADKVSILLDVGFTEEVHYPDWIANVVLVKKANGKWRVYVDYLDLNKACPNDSFSLPRIDQLVDSTVGHELLSFLDAYSGYNQIAMHPPEKQKTTFVTDKGLYYYRVMSFGLKNAGATYQRLVNQMFAKQIGHTMEVYIDDMLVKSIKASDHLADLWKTFTILREY